MTKVTFEPIATHDQPSAEEKSDLASLRVAHTIAASMKVFMDDVNEETVILLKKAVDMEPPSGGLTSRAASRY